jgi:hypothetical protein
MISIPSDFENIIRKFVVCTAPTQQETCRGAERREILLYEPRHCNEFEAFIEENAQPIPKLFSFIVQWLTI